MQDDNPQPAALDQRLVGTWVNEKQINSPGGAGGFASFSTVMTMELGANGAIRQFTQSVGGGGEWSSNSGRTLDFEGTWRAANNTLLVLGMGLPDYTLGDLCVLGRVSCHAERPGPADLAEALGA